MKVQGASPLYDAPPMKTTCSACDDELILQLQGSPFWWATSCHLRCRPVELASGLLLRLCRRFISFLLFCACVCDWLVNGQVPRPRSQLGQVNGKEEEEKEEWRKRERERERDPRHKVDNICWPVHRIAGSCNRSDASLATDLENEEQLWTPRLLIGFGSRRSLVPLYPRNIPRDGLRLFWTACMTCFGSHHRILVSTISRVHCISFILIKKMKQKS